MKDFRKLKRTFRNYYKLKKVKIKILRQDYVNYLRNCQERFSETVQPKTSTSWADADSGFGNHFFLLYPTVRVDRWLRFFRKKISGLFNFQKIKRYFWYIRRFFFKRYSFLKSFLNGLNFGFSILLRVWFAVSLLIIGITCLRVLFLAWY